MGKFSHKLKKERISAMDAGERKKYELSELNGLSGTKDLLFVQGGGAVPELAPERGYGCIAGNGTSEGVIKAFEEIIMSSEWRNLETMQVTQKLLHFLNRKKVIIESFAFVQSYELFALGRHDICVCFKPGEYSMEELAELIKSGLMESNVAETDMNF